MISAQHDTLVELLLQNIPRDLVMGIEDALQVGAVRGHAPSVGMNDGHKPSVIGYMRHFHMNETFHDALSVGGANPNRIHGNKIVVGRSGIFSVARFNITAGGRSSGHRSKTRREMAKANRAVEPLIQPSLFGATEPIAEATVFFVASFNAGQYRNAESPFSIEIAVPDHKMTSWLFRESVHRFATRYDAGLPQVDLAVPTLKNNIIELKLDKKIGRAHV